MTPSNSPEEGTSEAYSDGEVGSLELIWGAGYLSPGGPDAVARIIRDVPVAEKVVLDLGCGIGGPAIALVEVHRAKHVTGIDIVPRNLERAASAVATAGLADRIALRLVEPGPLPFADATFDVIPITSSLISVDTERAVDLDDVMESMIANDDRYRYSVAWIDSMHPSGRGVITRGDHAPSDQLPAEDRQSALAYDPKVLATAPAFVPGGLLNKLTVRAFNEAWFRKAPKRREAELQPIAEFFHPLDFVQEWNRVYGPGGFVQYQFVVPDSASEIVGKALRKLRKVGAPSFLTVLKRFGPANAGPLSFPQPGWTLAADVPASVPGLGQALDQLDELVAGAGGRLYLAKDSRQSPDMLARTYPRLAEWQAIRDRMDPKGLFTSDLARRLSL